MEAVDITKEEAEAAVAGRAKRNKRTTIIIDPADTTITTEVVEEADEDIGEAALMELATSSWIRMKKWTSIRSRWMTKDTSL